MAGYAPLWQMVTAVIRAGQAYARVSGFLPGTGRWRAVRHDDHPDPRQEAETTLLDGEADRARRWGMTLGAASKAYLPAGA
jgi:hypothetical protein